VNNLWTTRRVVHTCDPTLFETVRLRWITVSLVCQRGLTRGRGNSGFATSARAGHTCPVKNVLALVATSALLLSACASTGTTDPSAAPGPAKTFCDAMAAAAVAAPPAVTALDGLFSTMDAMSAGSTEGDLDGLHAAGTETVSTATDYAAALNDAATLAPASTVPDLETLSGYWTLYVVGLGQIAETATSYGSMIDQTTALESSEQANALVTEQPSAQQRVNDSYISECTTG